MKDQISKGFCSFGTFTKAGFTKNQFMNLLHEMHMRGVNKTIVGDKDIPDKITKRLDKSDNRRNKRDGITPINAYLTSSFSTTPEWINHLARKHRGRILDEILDPCPCGQVGTPIDEGYFKKVENAPLLSEMSKVSKEDLVHVRRLSAEQTRRARLLYGKCKKLDTLSKEIRTVNHDRETIEKLREEFFAIYLDEDFQEMLHTAIELRVAKIARVWNTGHHVVKRG